MSSIAPFALSIAFRAIVLTYAQGNDIVTGLLLGCWDGAFIHQAWIDDRALEPLTLLQIIAGTCFDLSYRSSVTNLMFIVLGGLLGALLSDTGVLRSGLGRTKGISLDVDLDDIADAFSGIMPSIKDVDYDSDSSYSSSITIKVADRRDSRRPSTRLSNYSRLTGLTSKSAQSRSLSSLPPLTIPEKRRSGLPILTVGSSDAGDTTPKAKKIPSIPQSWLPASGSFIPRTYSAFSTRSDKARQHRSKSEFGDEHDDDLPPRASFVRPRDYTYISRSVSVDSDVPEIQVVPPDESLPAFSPGIGYEIPRSPSKPGHKHSDSETSPPAAYTQNAAIPKTNAAVISPRSPSIRKVPSRTGSRPSSPTLEQDAAIPPPSPARTTISIRTIRSNDGTPEKTIINVVPVPSQQPEGVAADQKPVPVPAPSLHMDARNDEPMDWADYVSEATAPESVVSFAPRNSMLAKAEQYRQLAMQALDRKSQLQVQKAKAERERRWAEAFSLKHQIEEQDELAKALNSKAERRYHAAHNSTQADNTIDVHGLRPAEAIKQVDLKLRKVQLSGGNHLRVIVGRGKHSKGGIPVLKPAVRDHMLRQNLRVLADRNPGLLHVYLP